LLKRPKIATLTIGKALHEMGRSGFGFVILLLALPALIPIPGPFGLVFGLALAIVRRKKPLASVRPSNPKISERAFASMQRYAAPILRRIERLVRPGRMRAKNRYDVELKRSGDIWVITAHGR
jgi:hypothetical protein